MVDYLEPTWDVPPLAWPEGPAADGPVGPEPEIEYLVGLCP